MKNKIKENKKFENASLDVLIGYLIILSLLFFLLTGTPACPLLRGARQVVGGIKLPSGERLPQLRSYMDDVTSILQTVPCTTPCSSNALTNSLHMMKVKAGKSRSLSLRKGVLQTGTTFWGGAHPTAGRENHWEAWGDSEITVTSATSGNGWGCPVASQMQASLARTY